MPTARQPAGLDNWVSISSTRPDPSARRVWSRLPMRTCSPRSPAGIAFSGGLGMELRHKDNGLTIQADGQPEFEMEGARLFVQGTKQRSLPFARVERDIFVAESVAAEIDFTRDASGKIISLTLKQRGQILKGERHQDAAFEPNDR